MRRSFSSSSLSSAYLWWGVEELARESLYDRKRRVLERIVGAEDIERPGVQARGSGARKRCGQGGVPSRATDSVAERQRMSQEG